MEGLVKGEYVTDSLVTDVCRFLVLSGKAFCLNSQVTGQRIFVKCLKGGRNYNNEVFKDEHCAK